MSENHFEEFNFSFSTSKSGLGKGMKWNDFNGILLLQTR